MRASDVAPHVARADSYMGMPNEVASLGPEGECMLGDKSSDRGFIELCRYRICDCDASGRTVDLKNGFSFDVAVDEQEANGSIMFGGKLYDVRLTRDP
ncbi:hypothetical protein [Sorangium sp. So ce1000]|uniref:hypothetical protein n=1 Tax=Sorangium sp. So ce1000 TaxID=3133325 RepID=UPI003F5F9483